MSSLNKCHKHWQGSNEDRRQGRSGQQYRGESEFQKEVVGI